MQDAGEAQKEETKVGIKSEIKPNSFNFTIFKTSAIFSNNYQFNDPDCPGNTCRSCHCMVFFMNPTEEKQLDNLPVAPQ